MSSQSDVFIVDFIFEYLKKIYTDIVLLVAKEDERRKRKRTTHNRADLLHSILCTAKEKKTYEVKKCAVATTIEEITN